MGNRIKKGLLIFLGFFAVSCGQIKLGSVQPYVEPAPAGTVVAQGDFQGLYGKNVTGSASVYRLAESNTYVIRLDGLTAPSENNLQVVGKAGGQTVFVAALTATTGSQNYPTGLGGSLVWTSVVIHSLTNTSAPDYGQAILSQVN